MNRKERLIWIMIIIFIILASTVPINFGQGWMTLFDHVFYVFLRVFMNLQWV